jgi:hypothetical protein
VAFHKKWMSDMEKKFVSLNIETMKTGSTKMIKLALKFTKALVQLSLIGKELDDVEFFVLDSLDKGYSFSEISEAIKIRREKLYSFFSYLEGKYIKDGSLSKYGKEVLNLNRFVKKFNAGKKYIYIDKYKKRGGKVFYPESSGVFSKEKKGFIPLKENNFHYKVRLLFEEWIAKNHEERTSFILSLVEGEITEEEKKVIVKNRDFIAVKVIPEKGDYYILKEISLSKPEEFIPSSGENPIGFISVPFIKVKVSVDDRVEEIFSLSPYVTPQENRLESVTVDERGVRTTELPLNCKIPEFSCQISSSETFSVKVERVVYPIGEKLLKIEEV